MSSERRGGRIRSADAHDAVLAAAAELLEEHGYRDLTIEKIAARSGVAKSTIYRWWRSRPELVMEAYARAVAQRMPEPDTGSVAGDLTEFVTRLYSVVDHPVRVRSLRGMMADAQLDPEFRTAFRGWVDTRRAVVADLLRRGLDRGELAADLDLDHAIDLVFGPFWYRLLTDHAPLRPDEAGGHVRRLLAGLRTPLG
ncbi:TetR/AcrR family transcriptional regulator [Nocardia sp. 2]|uniref:TetR/AcrR family transcriptional regulator n=1 Tax=Nocardia acididurans TaxID=2802282 RepID=A0ABS1MF10_9NOCA|nr:TetR/AcrR family transcriptional regulator [Nocardia acididurans]MBL1079218.1 TetR/AcrR family transcriptional regulator [Nocardia acididurans]